MNSNDYKAARQQMKLTQGQLAELMGVSRKLINQRENGKAISKEAAFAMMHMLTINPKPKP